MKFNTCHFNGIVNSWESVGFINTKLLRKEADGVPYERQNVFRRDITFTTILKKNATLYSISLQDKDTYSRY